MSVSDVSTESPGDQKGRNDGPGTRDDCAHGVPMTHRCTACEWASFGREATPDEQFIMRKRNSEDARYVCDNCGGVGLRSLRDGTVCLLCQAENHFCRWCPHDWTGKGEG